MTRRRRLFRPITAVCAAILAASAPRLATCQDESPTTRRLEFMKMNSDEYAEAVLAVDVPKAFGIGVQEHESITSALRRTKELLGSARLMLQSEETVDEGRYLMDLANRMFREVKETIMRQFESHKVGREEQERELLRKRYSEHDVRKAQEDEKRALDISRKIYEMMVSFPDCIGELFEDCLDIINADLEKLGLSTIEVVVHEKRNANQEGYNKVVIITNELADRVKGRAGDGIVSYPFLWNDATQGQRVLGVDGKWNCHDITPDSCCNIVKQSVPNKDVQGNNIECHLFVPFGGVGNPRRNDRVFINLSPDGRVHEAPVIQ